MAQGYDYTTAHLMTMEQLGVSEYGLYAPDVIEDNPSLFNNNFRAFWGIGQ